jgi:hypothetical protein
VVLLAEKVSDTVEPTLAVPLKDVVVQLGAGVGGARGVRVNVLDEIDALPIPPA